MASKLKCGKCKAMNAFELLVRARGKCLECGNQILEAAVPKVETKLRLGALELLEKAEQARTEEVFLLEDEVILLDEVIDLVDEKGDCELCSSSRQHGFTFCVICHKTLN